MSHIKYFVRNYRDGDEKKLAEFANKTYEQHIGPVPKTAHYWRWSYVHRADIHPEGIFVVEKSDKEIMGYAVVSYSGVVYELCIHPKVDRGTVISMLLQKIESYARDQGAERISISIPSDDKTLGGWFTKSGYSQGCPYMVGIPLNFSELLGRIMGTKPLSELDGLKGEFLIQISKNGRRFRYPSLFDELFVFIEEEKILVEPDVKSYKADTTIKMDVFTFTRIILGTKSILKSIFDGEIKVTPLWKSYKAIQLLSLFVMPCSWYIPLGDRR